MTKPVPRPLSRISEKTLRLDNTPGLLAYFETMGEGERLAVPARLLPDFVEALDPKIELDIKYAHGVYYIRREKTGEN